MAQRGYADFAQGQIHFRQVGIGPVVILLHQAPGSSAMWAALLPELAALGRRAIAFDLPGYGLSDPPPQQPSLEYYARSIEAATVALGVDQFDIVGHHTGSSVALSLAALAPRRVRRIVAYGLALLGAEEARHLAEEPSPRYDAGGSEILAWWKLFTEHVPPHQAETLVPRYVADMLLSGPNRAFGHRAVGRTNHEALLRAVAVPVLAVAGRREMLYLSTKAAVGLSPMIEFHELGDAGIFVADERPAEFAGLIDRFLKGPLHRGCTPI